LVEVLDFDVLWSRWGCDSGVKLSLASRRNITGEVE
jgi:hypothetical protein